jgi:hypothetical protein
MVGYRECLERCSEAGCLQKVASAFLGIFPAEPRQVVSPFGVAGLTVPQYDIEFRGFTEFGVVNSVNPLNSLSYLRNSHPATLNRETTLRQNRLKTGIDFFGAICTSEHSLYVRPERDSWVFKFNPSQRLRKLFGWSSTYKGEL